MSSSSGSTDRTTDSPIRPFWLPWKQWETVGINISWLPKDATTRDLWEAFSREGNIGSIDIFDDRHGERSSRGRIRFKPPPKRAFWRTGSYEILLSNGRLVKLVVALDITPVSPFLRSPSREGVIDQFKTCAMRSFGQEAQPKIGVDVRSKALFAYFSVTIHEGRKNFPGAPEVSPSTFRLKIPFLQLARVWETHDIVSHEISLIIILDSPPVYHRLISNIFTSFSTQSTWRDTDLWRRQTSIAHQARAQDRARVNLRRSGQIIDLGRWNVFKLTLSTRHLREEDYRLLIEMLKDHNVSIETGQHFKTSLERPDPVWRWIDIVDLGGLSHSTLEEMAHNDYVYLPFNIRYQLEVCLSHRYLSEFTMSREFVLKLMEMGAASAVRLLEHVATNKKHYLDPMEIFKIKYPKGITDSIIPSYCCFMRTARITPTTVHYNTPTIDTSNRVTRNYQEYLDRFLRVRFADEKTHGRLYSTNYSSNDEIFARVKRALTNGITIGDRHYEFLAFGNSQFREHGAYFFAPTSNITAAHIRAWMGQFHHIRNVARYSARLGQCFSTTRALAGCNVTVKQIPDIVRNGYCFSDGIGKISKFTTRVISAEMGIYDPYGEPPSAYQFRLGGCKGMLTVSSDPIVNDVHIRPSQIKFEAEHKRLEIIRCSQFSAATLNRQLILVLSALGVKSQVFHDRLNAILQSINYAMHSDNQAIELLERFIDPNRVTLALAQMVSAGFRRTNEPFVSSMLALWKSWHQKYLKEKAKILIEQGASLLGVLDETATLKGYYERRVSRSKLTEKEKLESLPEIFVQISSIEKGVGPRVIEGVCIVARNPSLHPGDVRVVRAVDCKALRHLVDVIVFPQTGDRDVPSMCSGGDLDGDDYLVIWDQELIPRQWFEKPLTYAGRKAPDLDRNVTINDITSFYVTYMKNDSLPRIAHAHMAHADHLVNGVYEPKCVRLAQLHSDAVDYNKTGIPAVMERGLEPRIWPHFMDKKNKRKYHSKSILGQLYDAVKTEDFTPNLSNPFDFRILQCGLLEESRRFEYFASELKVNYDTSLRRIMAQYGINTEFEVWSTFVLDHNSMCRDYKLHEDLGKVANGLRLGIREQCYKHLGGKRDFGHVAPLAVAMYRITHQEFQEAFATLRGENAYDDQDDIEILPDDGKIEISRLPFISFPWVFDSILCKIVKLPLDELHNALAEAHASNARNAHSKIYTHDQIMLMVQQERKTESNARSNDDDDFLNLATALEAKVKDQDPDHFGDRDIYENDLYEKPSAESFSALANKETEVAGIHNEGIVIPEDFDKASKIGNLTVPSFGDIIDIDRVVGGLTEEATDTHNQVMDIIENEGDVQSSAVDELFMVLGDDYDADNEDDC